MQFAISLSKERLLRIIRNPGFWFILILMVFITIPHYAEAIQHPTFLVQIMSDFGLTRHAFERILFLAPIVWAGFLFGWKGATTVSVIALGIMIPRALLISFYMRDALFETAAVFIIGNVLAISFDALHKERQHRLRLESTQKQLQDTVQAIRENEKRLAALNQVSNTVSQSLELSQVLSGATNNVVDVMQANNALLFLLDERKGELVLAAHRGISEDFARGVDRLKVGEGINGRVAASGEPLFIENISKDPRLTRDVVAKYGIHSVLVVPLSSKGRVNGTLCVGTRTHRRFQQEEIELLTTIGNQISVAVDNARLYQQQQQAAEELRASEERYRELFENAHDAIWVQDLDGNILNANATAAKMSGYSFAELTKMNVKSFLSEESLVRARQIKSKLLNNQPIEQPYEQRIIRRDGTDTIVQLTTTPIFSDGKITGFQHIARDITEQKRMQENLRFYLEQATRAQEEERKRISRELHDDTVQALVVLSRQLDAIISTSKGLTEENRARLEDLWQRTNSVMQGVRRLSQDLRPPALDRLGLIPALEWLASDVASFSGIPVKVNVRGAPHRLSEEMALVLFRIVQEALRNVWRHSQATRAEINVEFNEGKLTITVADNGKGFNLPGTIGDLAKYGKLGLAGMSERARLVNGKLAVHSEPGKGTSVIIELPA